MLQKQHAMSTGERLIANHCIQLSTHCDTAHGSQVIPRLDAVQNRCLATGRIGAHQARQQIEPGFIHKNNRVAVPQRLFLSSGHTVTRHSWMRASSRWIARVMGICGVQRRVLSKRETCALWYEMPNSWRMTAATRPQVHTSPRKPYAWAPWLKRSGSKCSCWQLSLSGPWRCGLARHGSMPGAPTAVTHWLTAASETSKAYAISRCFQPSALSSRARLRRASLQSFGHACLRFMLQFYKSQNLSFECNGL
jgi:hypothetical protein